jgi:hypothetical protein
MINGSKNMEEIYHKKNINYVFGRELFVDKIEYNDHELKIFLDNENIKLQLFFTYIFSSRIIDEGCFLKTLNEQNLTIGLYYSCKSNYLSWFHEQSSNIYLNDSQLKHYVLATQNEIIEIITQWEPDLKIL